jgi:hypothetical protein
MKKYILSLLAFSVMLAPVMVSSQADFDPNPSTSSCVSLVNNLRYQSRDTNTKGEVSTLQDFLQSRGYLNSEPTGYFGLLTTQAAKSFQSASGINGDGYVGPITRAKIRELTCRASISPDNFKNPSQDGPRSGCFPGALYSSTTGERCGASSNLPAGCTSTSNFSSTTGQSCKQKDHPEPSVEVKSNNGEKVVSVNKGESVYVTWTSQNTYSCAAVGSSWDHSQLSDKLVTSGYIGVIAEKSGEYTISCKGLTKTVSDSMRIQVNSSPVSTCSSSGYDSRTGLRCGCTSTYGYSSTTGEPCDGSTPQVSSLFVTTPSQLPNAKVGQPYSVALNVSGSSDAYPRWSINNGQAGFPVTGLGLSAAYGNTVYITGIPAKIYFGGVESKVANTFNFSVSVASGSQSASKKFTLTVEPAPQLPTISDYVSIPGGSNGPVRVGDTVMVFGSNFDSSAQILISGGAVVAPAAFISTSQVNFTLPFSIPVGTPIIEVRTSMGSSNPVYLSVVASFYPGCSSWSGFSSVDGEPCNQG